MGSYANDLANLSRIVADLEIELSQLNKKTADYKNRLTQLSKSYSKETIVVDKLAQELAIMTRQASVSKAQLEADSLDSMRLRSELQELRDANSLVESRIAEAEVEDVNDIDEQIGVVAAEIDMLESWSNQFDELLNQYNKLYTAKQAEQQALSEAKLSLLKQGKIEEASLVGEKHQISTSSVEQNKYSDL